MATNNNLGFVPDIGFKPDTMTQEKEPGFFKKLGSALISSEKAFGEDIVSALPESVTGLKVAREAEKSTSDSELNFMRAMGGKKQRGETLTPTQQRLMGDIQGNLKTGAPSMSEQFISESLPGINKTPTQIAADAAGVALDIGTAGTIGTGMKSLKLAKTAGKVAEATVPTMAGSVARNIAASSYKAPGVWQQIGKNYLKSATTLGGIGYAYDVVGSAQEGDTSLTPGSGALIGSLLPIPFVAKKAVGAGAKGTGEKLINSLIKPLLKDFSYGKNPGRGVAAEGIVGNSLEELAQNIGTRVQERGAEIGQVTAQLDSKAGRSVNLTGVLAPLDNALAEASKFPETNSALIGRIEGLRRDLSQNIANEIATWGEAFNLKQLIGKNTKWTGNPSDDKTVNIALKRIYGGVREAMEQRAEEVSPALASKLKSLNERYGDLLSAEVAAKYRDKIDMRQAMISLKDEVGAGGVALATAILSGGAAIPTILAGAGALAIGKIMKSPAVKTRLAAWLAKESPSIVERFMQANPAVAKAITDAFQDLPVKTKKQAPRGTGTLLQAELRAAQNLPEFPLLPPGRPEMGNINQGRAIQSAPEGARDFVGTDVVAGGRYTPASPAPIGDVKPLTYDTETGNMYEPESTIQMGNKPRNKAVIPTLRTDKMSAPDVGAVPTKKSVLPVSRETPDQGRAAIAAQGGVKVGEAETPKAPADGKKAKRSLVSNAQSGKAGMGTISAAAALPLLMGGIPSRTLTYERQESDVPQEQNDTKQIKSMIAYNESRGEKRPYSFRKPSGIPKYGDDLGKYQITEATLRETAKQFIGHDVSADAFVASPTLQEKYMDGRIQYLLSEGLTVEDILALHREGLTGYGDPKVLAEKREHARSYVQSGLRSLELTK